MARHLPISMAHGFLLRSVVSRTVKCRRYRPSAKRGRYRGFLFTYFTLILYHMHTPAVNGRLHKIPPPFLCSFTKDTPHRSPTTPIF
jgi:hypothetical protein